MNELKQPVRASAQWTLVDSRTSISTIDVPTLRTQVSARKPDGSAPKPTVLAPSDVPQVPFLVTPRPCVVVPRYDDVALTVSARPQSLRSPVMLLKARLSTVVTA